MPYAHHEPRKTHENLLDDTMYRSNENIEGEASPSQEWIQTGGLSRKRHMHAVVRSPLPCPMPTPYPYVDMPALKVSINFDGGVFLFGAHTFRTGASCPQVLNDLARVTRGNRKGMLRRRCITSFLRLLT